MSLVHVDATQDEEAIVKAARLEEPVHFKTTPTGGMVGQDVKDHPKLPPDWYRNKDEQVHVSEADWKYVDVTTKNRKVRKIKMGLNWRRKKSKNIASW